MLLGAKKDFKIPK